MPQSFEGTWEKLSQVAVKGAEYDSRERQPHPKCLKGTRVDLLNYIHRLLDKTEDSRLVWLHGTAGVGKSAVAFTVAERMRNLKVTEQTNIETRLAGSFFFSRTHPERCTTGYFSATLAYQLACNFPSVREDLNRTIRENPALLDPNKSLRDQMEGLFLRPLRKLQARLCKCPPTFVVDALDECMSETEVGDLISLLGRALREPGLPVIHILLTSRSEAHIREAIQDENVHPLVCEIPGEISGEGVAAIISLDGADVDDDIYIFLEDSFRKLRRRYSNFPQPTSHELAQLASRAGRRFIVASTMMKFIDDGYYDPRDRLHLMLEFTSELLPGTEIYKLYDRILATCTNPARAYLHLSVVASLTNPLSISQISQLLGPGEGRDVETSLVQLRSVMDIPAESSLPVKIFHSSVCDYISDPSNCSLPEVRPITPPHSLLADSSLRLMMRDIPSTALLNAFSKLNRQSQATQSHDSDPQTLTRSLSFIVQPPEPLQILKGLLWVQGYRSFYLRSWLETLDGHEWLHAQCVYNWVHSQGRKDWLRTQEGMDWLQTQGGGDWLQTRGGQFWLKTRGGQLWLQTQGGQDWLQTYSGHFWLRTTCGQDWLRTRKADHWLQTQGGRNWLQTRAGQDWLHTQSGRWWLQAQQQDWLQTQGGQDWLESQEGRDWLDESQSGQEWLHTWSGYEWLCARSGREWLHTRSGREWLRAWSRRDWPQTRQGLIQTLNQGLLRTAMQGKQPWWNPQVQKWLQTWRGRDWLENLGGQYWVETRNGRDWLQTKRGGDWLRSRGGQNWLQTEHSRDWMQTETGKDWVRSRSGQDWIQSESGEDWLQSENGEIWLQSESGEDWLQSENGENWLQSESGQDWLQSERGEYWPQNDSGRDWLQTRSGQYWLQTTRGRDWLQTRGGQCWLHTPHGRAWQSTPSASVWVTMEEFSSTLEAISKYTIPELSSQPAFQVIQKFKSLPDCFMLPVFLALRHQHHSNSAPSHGRGPEIIRAMETFVHFAKGAQERSRSASDALRYACQNWPVHLSLAPNPWDATLNHLFKAFWNRYLVVWLERQWCLKGLRSCLAILTEGQKLAKKHLI